MESRENLDNFSDVSSLCNERSKRCKDSHSPLRHFISTMARHRLTMTHYLWIAILFLAQFSQLDASLPSSVSGFYTDDTAQQTIVLDTNRISPRQKKDIRKEILHLLGLKHRPKVPSRMDQNSAPQYMLELYKSLEDEEGERKNGALSPSRLLGLNLTLPDMVDSFGQADLIMSFVNQARIHNLFSDGGRRFYFDFSQVPQTEGVTGAELRIFKYSAPWLSDQQGPFTITFYKIRNDHDHLQAVVEIPHVLVVSSLEEGWLNVDVTSAIEHWREQREDTVVVYMQITDEYGENLEPISIGLVDNAGPDDKQAFLVTCFKANHRLQSRKSRTVQRISRQKRSPASSSYYSDEKDYRWTYPADRSSKKACQRRQLYVSFRALRWESWVIAPEGYPAFYCDGECVFPLNVHMNATNHAIVQALVHLVKPFLAPNPCCAPTILNGISFLYLDNSYNVVLKMYKNMSVQACGCH